MLFRPGIIVFDRAVGVFLGLSVPLQEGKHQGCVAAGGGGARAHHDAQRADQQNEQEHDC